MTKAEKRDYDIEYRKRNKEKLKKSKQKYCESPEGRLMQKRGREKQKDRHKEYVKTDKYRAWKKEYDVTHRAKKVYGEFWESSIIFRELDSEIDKYVASITNNTYNKSQKRKRLFNKIN